jgi:hypothetical protein
MSQGLSSPSRQRVRSCSPRPLLAVRTESLRLHEFSIRPITFVKAQPAEFRLELLQIGTKTDAPILF